MNTPLSKASVIYAEIRIAVADFMTKFNAGDLDAVMELQSNDCRVMPPFGPLALWPCRPRRG
jgi:ketosteroid isomerase-like protein